MLKINFPDDHPAWVIMATIRNGEYTSHPVRDRKGQTSCDKIAGTRFPSVSGNAGDMLLLSQSFDDGAGPPGRITPDGGAGSPGTCKDLAVSIVIRKSGT